MIKVLSCYAKGCEDLLNLLEGAKLTAVGQEWLLWGNLNVLSSYTLYIAGKFGGELNFGSLAVYIYYNRQIKLRQISYSHNYICMAIPYQTAKFNSANILAIAILGSTAKFNFHPDNISAYSMHAI